MGNNPIAQGASNIEGELVETRRESHDILGAISFLANKTRRNDGAIMIEKNFISECELNTFREKMTQRVKISELQEKHPLNEFLIKVTRLEVKELSEFCSKTYKMLICIEQFQTDLQKVMTEKLYRSQSFTEAELVQFSLSIVKSLMTFYDFQIKSYHLSLSSIVQVDGSYKLIDRDLSGRIDPLDCLNTQNFIKSGVYLAPELLQKQDYYLGRTPKSDIFTLGMLCLELSAMKPLDHLYDYPRRRFSHQEMNSILSSIEYSGHFKETLKLMLQESLTDRIGFLKLREALEAQLKSSQAYVFQNRGYNTDRIYGNISYGKVQMQSKDDSNLVVLGSRRNRKLSCEIKKAEESKRLSAAGIHPLYNNRLPQNRQKKSASFRQPQEFNDCNSADQRSGGFSKRRRDSIHNPRSLGFGKGQNKQQSAFEVLKVSRQQSEVPISPISYQRNDHIPSKRPEMRSGLCQKQYGETSVEMAVKNRDNRPCNIESVNYSSKVNAVIKTGKRELFQKQNTPFLSPQKTHFRVEADLQESNGSKAPKFCIDFKQSPTETPIKSLELMQTAEKKDTINRRQEGRHEFSNKAVYEGEFNAERQFEGNGTLYFPNGKTFYSGSWKRNQFHGFGVLNNDLSQSQLHTLKNHQINYRDFNLNENNNWLQYEGEFFEDQKHGFGTLHFPSGDKFNGCFSHDIIEGFGSFYVTADHQEITGIWVNNILQPQ